MPRIDPHKLLTCLGVLLAPDGGIRSSQEVQRLASLMAKFSKKLVSKCIYIQILKCTETELLGQFMAAGGWTLTHLWLQDGITSLNWAFVQELLEMLLMCPVDGNRLKSNTAPRLVKTLSVNCPHNGVCVLATKLVEQWLKIAHQEKASNVNENTDNNNYNNGFITGNNFAGTELSSVDLASVEDIDIDSIDCSNKVPSETSPSKNDSLVFKITKKDGKKVLAKVESKSVNALNSVNSVDEEVVVQIVEVDEKSEKIERKKEHSDKSKSSESRDKDRERKTSSSHKSSSSSRSSSHKSSSSSSHHKSSSSSHKSSSSKGSSSSSSRDKDKDGKDREKHRSSSSSKHSSTSNSNNKLKEKEKSSQAEKDKDTLAKILPPTLNKLGKIPKKPSDGTSKKSEDGTQKAADDGAEKKEEKPPIKKSFSIEVRKGEKPKSVKTLNSQFRSHGLEEAPPPPSRKGLKRPGNSPTATVAPASVSAPKRSSPTPPSSKEVPPEKKIKEDLGAAQERVGGIKLIKPKPMLMESDMFMDALSASANPKKDLKKRKRIPSTSDSAPVSSSKLTASKQLKETDLESPKILKSEPLSFYKDTLDESEDDKKDSDQKEEVKADKSEENEDASKEDSDEAKDDKETKEAKGESTEEDEPAEPRPPGPGCGPDGPPGVLMLHRRKGKKKRIQWRPSEELIEIRYFELDETERVNVNKTFSEQRSMDRCDERKSMVMGRKQQSDDLMVEQTTWKFPQLVDNVPVFAYGSKSREAKIQADRERTVLQAIYFSRSLVPDSPTEPELEFHETTDPQVIPLDDLTGNPDAVNNFTEIAWPEPKSESAVRSQFPNLPNIPFGAPFNAPPAAFKMVPGAPSWGPMVPNPIFNNGMVFQPPPFMGGMPPTGLPMGMPNMQMPNRPPIQRGGWFRGGPPPPNRGPPTRGNWVQNQRNVCKQFQVKGYCRNGNNCNYLHQNF